MENNARNAFINEEMGSNTQNVLMRATSIQFYLRVKLNKTSFKKLRLGENKIYKGTLTD